MLSILLAGCVSTGPLIRGEGREIAGRTYVVVGASSGFGRGVASELGAHGANVATIMPWAVDTPFWTHAGNYSGGTPRMAMMDDPRIVVNAILRASLRPHEEVPVGWKVQGATWARRLAPDLTERFAADVVQRYQVDTAPPAPPTTGAIHTPMAAGRTVDGGARQRMKAEDEAGRIISEDSSARQRGPK